MPFLYKASLQNTAPGGLLRLLIWALSGNFQAMNLQQKLTAPDPFAPAQPVHHMTVAVRVERQGRDRAVRHAGIPVV